MMRPMPRLSDAAIDSALATLPGWVRVGEAIERRFTCRSFPDAVAFVAALVPEAEAADHHPDLEIHYRTVVVSYTTHSEGGLTQRDVDGARMVERAWSARG